MTKNNSKIKMSEFWMNYHSTSHSCLPTIEDLGALTFINRKDNILEIGYGDGRNLLSLKRNGFINLSGTEIIEDTLARNLNYIFNITLHIIDSDKLPFNNLIFDVVILSGVISTITDFSYRNKLIHEILRVSKRKGTIILVDFIYDNKRISEYEANFEYYKYYGMFRPGWSKIPFVHYSPSTLRSFFTRYKLIHFEHLKLISCQGNTDSGIFLVLKNI